MPKYHDYKVRGRLDDLMRFMRNHGIVLEFNAVRPRCFLIDTEMGERVLKAIADGVEFAVSNASKHARFIELAQFKGLKLNEVSANQTADSEEVRDTDDEDGDYLTILDDDDLEPLDLSQDEPAQADEDAALPDMPVQDDQCQEEPCDPDLPLALLFLRGAYLEPAPVPLLVDHSELGALSSPELDMYESALIADIESREAMLTALRSVRQVRTEAAARRAEEEYRRQLEAQLQEAEAALALATAEAEDATRRQQEAAARTAALKATVAARKSALS